MATLRKTADKFIFGWSLLLLTNFVLLGLGWIADVFAIFSKVIVLQGIIDQDFIILTRRIQRELVPHSPPPDTGYGEEGGLKLITPPQVFSNIRKANWIRERIQKDVKNGVSTYIFSFQDVIPNKELRRMKWINPEKVFVFLFSSSSKKVKEEFTVLPMGITHVGATLSEVIKKHSNLENGCTVFFTDLSLLVHLFGALPCYTMLLNKMGSLREEEVNLFAFIHPETHSDKSVVSLFTSISDKVIKL